MTAAERSEASSIVSIRDVTAVPGAVDDIDHKKLLMSEEHDTEDGKRNLSLLQWHG